MNKRFPLLTFTRIPHFSFAVREYWKAYLCMTTLSTRSRQNGSPLACVQHFNTSTPAQKLGCASFGKRLPLSSSPVHSFLKSSQATFSHVVENSEDCFTNRK